MIKWYKIDNVGKFYSFTNKGKIPAVFRYSVSLKKNINPGMLQQALDETLAYFPNFNCQLRKGIFWYYLETSSNKKIITFEDTEICSKIYRDEYDVLFRVNFFRNRINFEVSHILSDGRGSLEFFKYLVTQYICIRENIDDVELGTCSSIFDKNEDSFDKYYTGSLWHKSKTLKTYIDKGRKRKRTAFFEYHISTNKVLEIAHQYHVSLTALIISVLICSFHQEMKQREYNKAIKIEVPVDLRQYFDSSTCRNFFGLLSINYVFNSKEYIFKDVVENVNEQLKEKRKIDNLKVRMNNMVFLEKNILSKVTPLFIKNFVLNIADYFSKKESTSSVSNIGEIKMDKKIEPYINNFNVLNTADSLKVTVCSFKDDLSIGISTLFVNNNVIKNFCHFFVERHIEGIINTNEVE